MYSNKKSVLQLLALLKAHGITQIVLSPGSRNAPLTHSFVSDSDFSCYSVVDERSAGFFALGVIQATQRPAAVCCTSGTAALNLGPAVAEAYYQQLPMLVITADRPPAWIGQMDGQTVPQNRIFSGIIRKSVQLPEIKANEDEWHCNRLINEAILSLGNDDRGPAHINIPLSEPLFTFDVEELPLVRIIRRPKSDFCIPQEKQYVDRFRNFSKIMIIVGQLPPDNGLADIMRSLSDEQGVVVLADQLSNIAAEERIRFDAMLRTKNENELRELIPDLVITLGGHIVSKGLRQFIRKADIKELWHITPSGEVIDTFQSLTDIIRCDYFTFLHRLTQLPANEKRNSFCELWENACTAITPPKIFFSDLYVTGELLRCLPERSTLHLANSHSVYLAQLFDIPTSVHVLCNRGTNGIEGSLSTAVGYAAASERLTFLLTGDLSFFYDMNGLWNKHIASNLRILVNNNGGGGIFHTLPGLNASEALDKYIAAAHSTDAHLWAEQQGLLCLTATNAEELQEQLPLFMNHECDRPVLLEVFTSMEANREQSASYYQRLKTIKNDT